MATDFGYLDIPEEYKLHESRLLPIENKPFQRVSKHLLQPASQLYKRSSSLPSPPPDASETSAAELAAAQADEDRQRSQWREEMMLDFAALESTMVRIQLLQNSNEQERQRYAKEKIHILETQEAIKANTSGLRKDLEAARATMEQKKRWDEMADKIHGNMMLKSREDQAQMQDKLNAEIAEQEQEMEEYAKLIAARKAQMGVIGVGVKEMMALLHPEEQEPESQEGTEGAETRNGTSQIGTPRDGSRSGTPDGLKVRPGSRGHSRAVSMAPSQGGDVEMADTAQTPGGVESSNGEIEEGEMET
ncbi:hypothetical protein E2P81_ATG11290 [Venturia nashicola]|uniref:Uncharacterized protein n=1 Tax=Venturia nashicola TaxID=86259 RepID=A0A4Z1P0T6_9PEZI|nr:hypothetical protein E6O75_ATG10977 [Venturia nashicola]TLD35171.1 hypothetical protein E2P81_ATG11290 [Venturia nashicola]